MEPLDWSRARIVRRGPRRGLHYTLRVLRRACGKAQTDVSEATGIAQGDVSRLERRTNLDECVVSTLRRYVEALGGELELVAVFPKTGHRMALAPYRGKKKAAKR